MSGGFVLIPSHKSRKCLILLGLMTTFCWCDSFLGGKTEEYGDFL